MTNAFGKTGYRLLWVALAAVMACGTVQSTGASRPTADEALKMRHQIVFRHGDEVHVFEGYLILMNPRRLLVKAFAGPGVDLFTVARDGNWHREVLHLSGLENKIDMTLVADSIFRVYMAPCPKIAGRDLAVCERGGEQMEEYFDSAGRLTRRLFDPAKIEIRYQNYQPWCGQMLPEKISITWSDNLHGIEIHLADCAFAAPLDPDMLKQLF
jgi:hypothetical protein